MFEATIASTLTPSDATFRTLLPCEEGDWCSLGRGSSVSNHSNLLCPQGTFCAWPSVLRPSICNNGGTCPPDCDGKMPYCPAGSFKEALCPGMMVCEGAGGLQVNSVVGVGPARRILVRGYMDDAPMHPWKLLSQRVCAVAGVPCRLLLPLSKCTDSMPRWLLLPRGLRGKVEMPSSGDVFLRRRVCSTNRFHFCPGRIYHH